MVNIKMKVKMATLAWLIGFSLFSCGNTEDATTKVEHPQRITITSIAPDPVRTGGPITVTGSGFGDTQPTDGGIYLEMTYLGNLNLHNRAKLQVVTWNADEIEAEVVSEDTTIRPVSRSSIYIRLDDGRETWYATAATGEIVKCSEQPNCK